jgi:hypothetical protein
MSLLAFCNSFCVDYLVRKRVALHITNTVLDGLPIPRLPVHDPLISKLGPLALRLTCTGPEMIDYWNDMVQYGWCEPVPSAGPPPGYTEAFDREAAKAQIDAIVAESFDLSAQDLGRILDTFTVLRRREEKHFGDFRTRRLVLDQYADL